MHPPGIINKLSVLGFAVCCCIAFCYAQKPPAKTAQLLFDFHSGFWINLHHFLYLEAASGKPSKGPHPAIVSEADTETLNSLGPVERSAWSEAVSYYAESVVQRDLLFDQNMGVIKNQLEDGDPSTDLANVNIPAAWRTVLLKAAPIYRKYWWKRHDAQNREWMAHLKPLVDTHGQTLKDSLVRIYETPWPGQPVRVDVAVYASQFGAYTTNEPTRPTISSTDPANQGAAALEIVFHETSHGMMDTVMDAIRAAETNLNAHHTNGAFHTSTLWHAVLFYTAGELVSERIPGYVPYADKNGLWTRAWPGPDRSLIEQDWKPHIDGAAPLPSAITKLVEDLARASSHH